jgi:hypothetical protein
MIFTGSLHEQLLLPSLGCVRPRSEALRGCIEVLHLLWEVTMKQVRTILASALGGLLLIAGGPAVAQKTTDTALTTAQVTAKLHAAGYTKVHGVELEGSHFDADAMKGGKAVHLHIDSKTGAITRADNESEEEEEEAREHAEHH